MRKIPFTGIELTSQRVRGYMVPLSYRGDQSHGSSNIHYKGCKYKATTWYLNAGSPLVVTLGQQYNVGEKPTAILYTYINHHAQPPIIPQHNHSCYITSRIRWVFKNKIKIKKEQMYPVIYGKKKQTKKTFRWDQRLQSFQGKIRTLHYI